MANEITYSVALTAAKGNIEIQRRLNQAKADMSGDAWDGGTQAIDATAGGTAVSISATVSSFGWTWLRNLDDTIAVDFGRNVSATFYPLFRLDPGEAVVVRLACATTELYARATSTGSALIEIVAIEA